MPTILFFFGDVDGCRPDVIRTGRDVPRACTYREALWWLWTRLEATRGCMWRDKHLYDLRRPQIFEDVGIFSTFIRGVRTPSHLNSMARSLLSKLALCLASFSLPQLSSALGKTDTITWGGDTSRAGYETNHNLDPRTVASADFGNIWIAKLPGNFNGIGQEQVLSQPLVYTTGDGIQYVFVATTQNNLYKINAKTGDIVKTRNLGVPFLAADLNSELLSSSHDECFTLTVLDQTATISLQLLVFPALALSTQPQVFGISLLRHTQNR